MTLLYHSAATPGFAKEWLLGVLGLSRVFIPKPVSTFGKPRSHKPMRIIRIGICHAKNKSNAAQV